MKALLEWNSSTRSASTSGTTWLHQRAQRRCPRTNFSPVCPRTEHRSLTASASPGIRGRVVGASHALLSVPLPDRACGWGLPVRANRCREGAPLRPDQSADRGTDPRSQAGPADRSAATRRLRDDADRHGADAGHNSRGDCDVAVEGTPWAGAATDEPRGVSTSSGSRPGGTRHAVCAG